MGNAKAFTRDAIEKIPLDGFAWCKPDGVHQTVQAVPAAAQGIEHGGDLRVIGNIAGKHQFGPEFAGKSADALLESFTLVSKGQLRALGMACAGNAVSDRTVA